MALSPQSETRTYVAHLLVLAILFFFVIQEGWCETEEEKDKKCNDHIKDNYPDAADIGTLFHEKDHSVSRFLEYCKDPDDTACMLKKDDKILLECRLRTLRKNQQQVRDLLAFYQSYLRLFSLLALMIVIIALMTHLTIVGHFEWKSLPIINLCYDKTQLQKKTHGVRYQQYIWMRYLVLRGTHRVFRKKDWLSVNWHKLKRQAYFDYKSVPVHRFTFLDKKNLTKYLVEEIENEAAVELLHGVHNLI